MAFAEVHMPMAMPTSLNGQHMSAAVQGVISTVAYTNGEEYREGGGESSSYFDGPVGVVFAPDGTLYVSEESSHRVRKVTPDGRMFMVAGNGYEGSEGDGKRAPYAKLSSPQGLALDAEGNLYIAEGSRVRKVTPEGEISTAVGGLGGPRGLVFDAAGDLYISEYDKHRVRKVNLETGEITTVAGNEDLGGGFSGDNRPAVAASLKHPGALCVDDAGNMYIADCGNNRVRKVDRNGIITTFAGGGEEHHSDGKSATQAKLCPSGFSGLVRDIDGSLYIADTFYNRVRKVDRNGIITTFAGTGNNKATPGTGDGGQAVLAELDWPRGLAFDRYGNLYIADDDNNRVRRVEGHQERSLVASQVKVPQVGLGETAELTVKITAYRAGLAVDAGIVVQRFTAPTGFAFADWPTYSYTGDDARVGSLGCYFESDRSVMVVTSDLHLNTGARDKGPLVYTIPVAAVAHPEPYRDGQLLIGCSRGVALRATITEGPPTFSLSSGGSSDQLVRGVGLRYPGVHVRGEGTVLGQTITATLPPKAGLAFKPLEGSAQCHMTVMPPAGASKDIVAELSADGQTLTCRNVDVGPLQKKDPCVVYVATVVATDTAPTGPAHLTFRVGDVESKSSGLEVVQQG
ncbi:hypothetical protein HTV45_27545 [Streptomyces sp. CHD11]|uniref:NHL domain-containing protein n=1 Tax=Streptomyces sp. CHD11 TaxID=2741325 RepID=UPI001BFCD02D|nr:hypothetical protein [Streptomyces sp. CHD11]MBT3154582.1 hypothetical protein [Streptomyces sp. CHD11]